MPPETGRKNNVAWEAGNSAAASANFLFVIFPFCFIFIYTGVYFYFIQLIKEQGIIFLWW